MGSHPGSATYTLWCLRQFALSPQSFPSLFCKMVLILEILSRLPLAWNCVCVAPKGGSYDYKQMVSEKSEKGLGFEF